MSAECLAEPPIQATTASRSAMSGCLGAVTSAELRLGYLAVLDVLGRVPVKEGQLSVGVVLGGDVQREGPPLGANQADEHPSKVSGLGHHDPSALPTACPDRSGLLLGRRPC